MIAIVERLLPAVFAAGLTFVAAFILGVAADQGSNKTLTAICDAVLVLGSPAVFFAVLLLTRRTGGSARS